MRHQVITHNMANINTPEFKRSRVVFEAHMSQALKQGDNPVGVRPQVVREIGTLGRSDGNNVDLENEMTSLALNQIWYAALTRQLADHYSRLRTVIHEGRR